MSTDQPFIQKPFTGAELVDLVGRQLAPPTPVVGR
jgi:hypothetical protein